MNNKEKNFISAVLYLHNAESRIEAFLSVLITVLKENFERYEIICVNDFSDDDSVKKVKQVRELFADVTIQIVNMSCFHGLEIAMNAGIDLAIGDFVMEFDTTLLDFDRDEIMRVYRKALEGYDVVSASPNIKEKVSSRLFYYIYDKVTSSTNKMSTESFRILSRRVINRISNTNRIVPYRKALYANCGLMVTNIKYNSVTFQGNDRKTVDEAEKHYRRRLAIDVFILFTDLGYRFSMTMTVLMMLITVFAAIYSLIIYLSSSPVEGWTTTILFISFLFFGLFGILTVIIKYLQIIVDLIFKRKRYTILGIEKL